MKQLILETRDHDLLNKGHVAPGIMITPPLNEDYWYWRVQVGHNQAIIGFPKFGTTGIGFAQEDNDWNTNLPFVYSAQRIFDHIKHNKGSTKIRDADCLRAIEMIRDAARRFKGFSDREWLIQEWLMEKQKMNRS